MQAHTLTSFVEQTDASIQAKLSDLLFESAKDRRFGMGRLLKRSCRLVKGAQQFSRPSVENCMFE
jgi:hypothetical protein